MNAQITQIPPIPVAMLKHTGSYDGIGAKFDQLWSWVSDNGIPAQRTIGIYWDNPEFTPANQLRSAACVELPMGYQATNNGSLPITFEEIAGGEYAIFKFVGPYENLEMAWSALTRWIENDQKRTISENPAFEVYVNDPTDTPSDKLITELYMPLA